MLETGKMGLDSALLIDNIETRMLKNRIEVRTDNVENFTGV